MSIRAVIWDMGGVIVRTEDYASRDALAHSLGLTRDELERVVFGAEWSERATVGAITHEELWQAICKQLKLPPEETANVQRAFWGGDRIDTELVAYIRSLRPKYRTALLSNAFSDLRQILTERWNIIDAFDEVIISAEVKLMKPDSRIFKLALERLGVEPGEAVFIDDFAENVRGAIETGLHAIRFLNSAQAKSELEALLKE